ncbi:MAG TPA: isochorismatase family cysteine hydrolase [Chloroflexota bacterium]|nr:isochorismatase family cysteine hydrolase [Chloroflexota bacterium]
MSLSLPELIDPSNAALLVVDVQNYYCHPDLASKWEDYSQCAPALANVHRLIAEARRIGVPVIYLRNWHEDCTDSPAWASRGGRDTIGLRANTWESDWYEVEPAPGEPIINKHRYSGFHDTRLDAVLHTFQRKSVIMTGVATNVCVESTARDAVFHDYFMVFSSDATATSNGQRMHQATLDNMRLHFGLVAATNDILGIWAGLPAGQPALTGAV